VPDDPRIKPATATLPVVHLSAAFVRNEDRVTGLNAGADATWCTRSSRPVLVATLQALIRARMAEDQLRRSEQRFRAIYDQAQSGIALLDAEGRFADVNPAMVRCSGAARRAHRPAVSAFAPGRMAPLRRQDRASPRRHRRRPGAASSRCCAGRLAGAPRMEHVRARRARACASRIASTCRSASSWSSAGARCWSASRRRAQVAERHSRTKDDFIAVLSHELRTPLNAIIGWVHILKRRGNRTPEMAKGLDAIERNVKAQARIISDILDVSRINSGKLRLDREWADPAGWWASSSRRWPHRRRESARIVDDRVQGAHPPAWLDPARFQQIFWNLMTNAIKFSPEGGRIVRALQREGDLLLLRCATSAAASSPTSWSTCSTASRRAIRPATASTAAWGSACRSSSTWPTCMAAACGDSEGEGHGADACAWTCRRGARRPTRRSGCSKPTMRAPTPERPTACCGPRRAGGGGRRATPAR
jgi:signal transduction histidine kinase